MHYVWSFQFTSIHLHFWACDLYSLQDGLNKIRAIHACASLIISILDLFLLIDRYKPCDTFVQPQSSNWDVCTINVQCMYCTFCILLYDFWVECKMNLQYIEISFKLHTVHNVCVHNNLYFYFILLIKVIFKAYRCCYYNLWRFMSNHI